MAETEHLSGTLWPVHLKPLEDELVSSWVTRLAHAHGLAPHVFCDLACGRRLVLNQDIDGRADGAMALVLSRRTATAIERVRNAALTAYEGRLYERHNPRGSTKWIMPTGVHRRARRRPGLQFCPACLREDEKPYFRRRWRLAFVAACEKHRQLLLDRCPRCRAPVSFHRNGPETESIAHCATCEHDLRRARAPRPIWAEAVAEIQTELLEAIEKGWVEIPGHGPVYSHLYFDALHQVMKVLATGVHSAALRRGVCVRVGMATFRPRFANWHRSIEQLSVEDRARLLLLARWSLDDWPTRLAGICRSHGVPGSILIGGMTEVPYWYWRAVRERLHEPDCRVSEREIRSAVGYLRVRGLPLRERRVSRLLGVSQVFRKRIRNPRVTPRFNA